MLELRIKLAFRHTCYKRILIKSYEEALMTARTILLVEDDADLRQTLLEQLQLYEEFDILAEETATKGIQTARAGATDLMIMDVGLPDMDGREAVKILRKGGFKAPIIMLTGHDTDSDTRSLAWKPEPMTMSPNRFALRFCSPASAPSCASTKTARM